MFDRIEVLELLLSRGADPERQDASGNTALIAAVMMGAPRAVARLDALAK
jgi:ankyrin repeat protein